MWPFRRRRGRAYYVRENFESLPQEEWTDDEYSHWFSQLPEEDAWQQWEVWSRQTRDPPQGIRGIHRTVLDAALEAAKKSDPNEFACLLGHDQGLVSELILVPTIQGDEHAIMDLWQAPSGGESIGTLHSHPDEHPYPSDADLELFAYEGKVHVILCRPYGPDDWRAYDFEGQPIHLEVIV